MRRASRCSWAGPFRSARTTLRVQRGSPRRSHLPWGASPMTAPSGLARKSIGTGGLFFFCVGASSPMAALAGGFVQTYAGTGVIGVPLSFVLLAVALGFFTVGYVAMTRYVPHAATFYALLARGLGRTWGMAGGTVALVSYNSIQICLYGLLGAVVSGAFG